MTVAQLNDPSPNDRGFIGKFVQWFSTTLGQIIVSILVPAGLFLVLWQGYTFLQKANAPQIVQVIIAIVWGVGGVADRKSVV